MANVPANELKELGTRMHVALTHAITAMKVVAPGGREREVAGAARTSSPHTPSHRTTFPAPTNQSPTLATDAPPGRRPRSASA